MPQEYYALNLPRIVYENVEEEILAIDTLTGSYFSVSKTGSQVWKLLADGISVAEMVEHLSHNIDADINQIPQHVTSFLEELLENNLIVVIEKANDVNADQEEVELLKIPYVVPKLNKFNDMQDLLLVDPIHDVDDRGWPHRAESEVSEG